ncbi:MAG: hypothetical protein R3D34_02310 [Nitratireductor sp.]
MRSLENGGGHGVRQRVAVDQLMFKQGFVDDHLYTVGMIIHGRKGGNQISAEPRDTPSISSIQRE